MKLFLLLVSLVASHAQDASLPLPMLGSFAAECVIPVESPINFGPGPFEIPADTIIRFNVPSSVRMVHAHFDAVQPDEIPDGFTVKHYEVNVRTTPEGLLVNQFFLTGDAAISQHIAVIEPVFDESLGPINPAGPEDILQGSVVTVWLDADGNEVLGEEQLYPSMHMNLCCPNSLPSPKGQPVLEDQFSWDSNLNLGAVEIDGGDFFIQDGQGTEWAYFCHEGAFMSCFLIPDGFSDPTFNRYQEVGGVATFTDDETGEEVDFECVFREDGNAQGDDRTQELSGSFKRLDELKVQLAAKPAVPVPGIGIAKAECRMTLNFPFEFLADPTLVAVDAAHDEGSEPFLWPADVSITGIDIMKQANRYHSHWGIPEAVPGLTLTGFEVTASQDGNIISQTVEDPDVNDVHVVIDQADPTSAGLVSTQIVAIYVDDTGAEVRSDPASWPDADLGCCPGNHPKPIQPLNLRKTKLESEIDGGSYSVTDLDGNTFTYFCINGQYHACQAIPDGFTDDLNQRYQPVGGVATFQDALTRIPRKFVCLLNESGDGGTPAGQVDPLMAGRFVPLYTGLQLEFPSLDVGAAAPVASSNMNILAWIGAAILLTAIVTLISFRIRRNNKKVAPTRESNAELVTYAELDQ